MFKLPRAISSNVENVFRFINAPESLVGNLQHLKQEKKNIEISGSFIDQPGPLLQLHEQTHNLAVEKRKQRGDLDTQVDSKESFRPSQIKNTKSKRKPPTTSKRGGGTGVTEPVLERRSTKEQGRQLPQEPAVMADEISTPGVGEISPSREPQSTNDESKKVVEAAAAEITSLAPAQTEKADQPSPARVQSETYKAINEVAKMTTAARTKKKVQTRKVWTDLETETLINLIQDHGTSWKLLKDKDVNKILLGRDQTSLKDKARNIKLDYLKWVHQSLSPFPFPSLYSFSFNCCGEEESRKMKGNR